MAKQGELMGTRSRGTLVMALLFVILAGASVVIAQLPTATILGVVRDPSGAVVPEVSLTARNVETGQSRAARSAADGSYRFQALPVGRYEVRAEHPGFQSEVRSGLTLTVAQEAVVNISLQVGAVEQTVAVTAEAPLVNTTSGSLGGLVDERKIADLPLNGRNYVDLTLLQTGVSEQKSVAKSTAYVGRYFSSNGAPVRSNNYLLDGANMTNLWGVSSASATSSTLGVDGIREYKVITNSFSAEYGMTMGSQMVIVSKGGTNSIHGSLFEFMRNSTLDARNFFDYKSAASQRRLPAFIRNNFGGSFGGPIKKDKTFFHAVVEGVRERLGATKINTVIPPAAKVDGGLVAQIAPVIKPVLAQFPNPNLPNNQFTYPFTQPSTDNYGQVRVDQTLSGKDSLFVRYTVQDTQQLTPGDYPQFQTDGTSRNQFATLSENRIFSPTLLNTARVSFSRTNLYWPYKNAPGMDSPQLALVPGLPMGGYSIGGITGIGSAGLRRHKQNLFAYSDDLFYTRGRHSLKFGVLYNRYLQVIENAASWLGSASFTTLTNFLLAQSQQISALTPGSSIERTYQFNALGFYAQDDWQVRSNFTLNLGLRYEFGTDYKEAHGAYSVIKDLQHDTDYTVSSLIFKNPSLKNFSPRFGFAWDLMGDGKTAVRGGFGLLYDLIGGQAASLVLQSQVSTPPYSNRLRAANPSVFTIPLTFPTNTVTLSPRPTDYYIQQPHMLQYNLTVERQLPFQMALTIAYAGSRGINLVQAKEGNPTVPLGIPGNNRTCVPRPAGQAYDIHMASCWLGNDPRTNPSFGSMDLFTAGSNSSYNALQFGLIKRLSKGMQFQSSYTWSKLLDEKQGTAYQEDTPSSNANGPDPTHRNLDRGVAAFDFTQVWKFNSIYQIPSLVSSGGAAAKLLNGWWLSGILSLQSGQPYTSCLQANRSRSGVGGGGACTDRPDLVLGRNAGNISQGASAGCTGVPAGTPVGNTERYFDPCAFAVPAAGFLGTAGRDILRGQGFANLDFSLVKDTEFGFLGESGKLQFRAEVFNILNRANFALPERTVFAGTQDVQAPIANAGQIRSTLGTSRQIQLALKILF